MMGTRSPAFASLAELVAWCRQAPAGTRLDAQEVAEILSEVAPGSAVEADRDPTPDPTPSAPLEWRARLWTVSAETRLGVDEVAEALGRPKSFIYARTGPKSEDPIPHRKLEGALTFTAGELRAWIRDREEVIHGGPMISTTDEKRGKLHAM